MDIVWTPDRLAGYLQEEIRRSALELNPSPRRNRVVASAGHVAQIIKSHPIDVAIVTIGVSAFGIAVTQIASHWPLGGGTGPSEVVIAQGASLIFVTIVLSLLLTPAEAGRTIGDATFVNRDVTTWVGLLVLAAMSLLELWIGALSPERAEENATLGLTAFGLASTAWVVRRLVKLTDVYEQLDQRRRADSALIRRRVQESAETTRVALTNVGVGEAVAAPIIAIPSPDIQGLVAARIRGMTAISRFAWQTGDWPLAARAHGLAVLIAFDYAKAASSLSEADSAFQMLRSESEDLYLMAAGPAGRWLSHSVISSLTDVGRALVALQRTYQDSGSAPADGLAGSIAGSLDSMVRDRLADARSPDLNAAMVGIGQIALAEAHVGHDWGAAHTAAQLQVWATTATNANRPEISLAAWSSIINMLVQVGRGHTYVTTTAFGHLADAFLNGLRGIPSIPLTGSIDPMGPITGGLTATPGGLTHAWYRLFAPGGQCLARVAEFSVQVAGRLVLMIEAMPPDGANGFARGRVAGVIYHSVAASIANAEDTEDPDLSQSIGERLAWLRRLAMPNGGFAADHDLHNVLHTYVSGWQLALFRSRERSELPQELAEELEDLLAALAGAPIATAPPVLPEGISVIASSLRRIGHTALADRTAEAAETVSQHMASERSPTWSPSGPDGWGMGGSRYFLFRGAMMGGIFERVEAFFAETH